MGENFAWNGEQCDSPVAATVCYGAFAFVQRDVYRYHVIHYIAQMCESFSKTCHYCSLNVVNYNYLTSATVGTIFFLVHLCL